MNRELEARSASYRYGRDLNGRLTKTPVLYYDDQLLIGMKSR